GLKNPNGGQLYVWRRREDLGIDSLTPGGERIAVVAVPSDIREPGTESATICPPSSGPRSSKVRLKPLAAGHARRKVREPRPPQRYLSCTRSYVGSVSHPAQCRCASGIPRRSTVSRPKSNSIKTAGSLPTTQPSC